eukprot:CAMPEP_0195282502 /NCGR_PEP_ID=MMETSP0707-20130614/1339_1 /TAXON_ID=33640 /ORGANISM="Asterionellopsis glacialis, Strain CCMP134" /LENGTH=579 /DNA_ID=CAMNT_0040341473 /DNA_START=91 /DNA_END=1830 /DNA_ORIENTATION=-
MAFCLTACWMVPSVRAFGIAKNSKANRIQTRLWAAAAAAADKPIPITLLSGFLGSGKTTTLKHLLENTDGVKIGVIVNDVAEVNIDAKLVAADNQGTIELQNGCACCSLADELLVSVENLIEQRKDKGMDAVVVELSGVADPEAVKRNWLDAKAKEHPVTKIADLSRVVTVVDACTFGTDWMTWDVAGMRDGWTDPADQCSGSRKVPELLAEQVEAANLIVVNKADLAGENQVEIATGVAQSINDKAGLYSVEWGKVDPTEVLGLNDVLEVELEVEAPSHSHSHDHDCAEPDCTDASHTHSHDHDCAEPDCTDASHSHDHDHACEDTGCTDPSHDHSHSHDHADACTDPDCTDESHDHSHSHDHSTAADKLGITNFVYKASRPFDTGRLMGLLNQWPVPIKDELDLGLIQDSPEENYEVHGPLRIDSPFVGVLRSKGFCWFAPQKWAGNNDDVWRHDTAMYWSHAGRHFGISSAGKWWGTVSPDKMKNYFIGNEAEYDRILSDDFVSEEFGDRRQEIVFIGTQIDQEKITSALNDCLLTDTEMNLYRQTLGNFLKTTLSGETNGPSLFDTLGNDHLDAK